MQKNRHGLELHTHISISSIVTLSGPAYHDSPFCSGAPRPSFRSSLSSFPPCLLLTHRYTTPKHPSHQTFFDRKKKLNTHHSTITTPMMIPANFSIATLFPCCAMRPNRLAEPFMEFVMEEKTSDCFLREREGVLAR